MAISGFLFISWRLLEIITLIPTLGMLAYFVRGYVSSNVLTPDFILVLFITSVLAAAWAIATTIAYLKARHSALFVATVDLGFMACFIAGVYLLRGIADESCTDFRGGGFYLNLGPFGYLGSQTGSRWAVNVNKTCAMLKASFAFGIMNVIFFFITFLLALLVHRNHRNDRDKDRNARVRRETHVHRHEHRRPTSRDNGRSNSPRRSHHSHRRQYYV